MQPDHAQQPTAEGLRRFTETSQLAQVAFQRVEPSRKNSVSTICSSLLEPLHPAAGVLAKTRFQILILPDRPQHESYAFGVGAREQQYPVPDDAVARSAGAWLRRTRSSRSLGTSRPSAPARRQIESLIAEGFAAHSSSISTATSMSLSRRAVPRARLPCSQARRTEESPPSACARRPLRLPTSSSPADTVMASLARILCRSHAETGDSRG